MALLRSLQTGEARHFERRLRIGRDAANDLVLALGTVSSFHAHIEWRGGAWCLRDLGSRNGTAVDGERAAGWIPLREGATLQFGPDSRWRAEALEPPAEAESGTFVEAVEGGARHAVREDRFTIGTGGAFDLDLPGGDGLIAILYQEDDRCRIAALAEGVSVGGAALAPGEPAELAPGGDFSVLGRSWRLLIGGDSAPATVEAGLKARAYGGYVLRLTQRGDFGDIELHDGHTAHRWPDHDRRFLLLWVLGEAVIAAAGEPGWVADEALKLAIWGRRQADGLSASTLSKLIHDTRVMLGRDGVDGLFIEKRRGRTRLRLSPDAVELLG